MPELRFDTGLVTYDVNNACQVSFNPTDFNFMERVFETFNVMDKLQAEQEAEQQQELDPKEIFLHARERDQEMRQLVDGIFGQPVCEALFGSMNLYAFADGLPVWCNLVFSIMDEMDSSYVKEQQRTNPRLAKYTAKYKRK